MGVATFLQPDFTTQSASVYKAALDACIKVLEIMGNDFAPHARSTPTMQVRVEEGKIFTGTDISIVAFQHTAVLTAPVTNPRIDRVVIDQITGAITVITGAEAGSPVAPAIPLGQIAICQVLLQTTSLVITNDMITDERFWVPPAVAPACTVRRVTLQSIADATWTDILWDAEEFDVPSAQPMHSLISNTDRLVAPRAGKYLVTTHVRWADPVALALYESAISLNNTGGAGIEALDTKYISFGHSDYGNTQQVSMVLNLAAADIVRVVVRQQSGGALNLVVDETWASIIYLGA